MRREPAAWDNKARERERFVRIERRAELDRALALTPAELRSKKKKARRKRAKQRSTK